MEYPQQPPNEALQQRFRDLTEQFHHLHAPWQEAYRQQDLARQMDLIDREYALLAEMQAIIAAFQQTVHEWRVRLRPLERTP